MTEKPFDFFIDSGQLLGSVSCARIPRCMVGVSTTWEPSPKLSGNTRGPAGLFETDRNHPGPGCV